MSRPAEDAFVRFSIETAEHAMTVLHNDGLYRHLRFQREWWQPPWLHKQRSSLYWFEIVTAPGMLTFNGDGESFTFRRTEDMFQFFRGPVGRINPQYWAEKVTSGQGDVTRYDREIFAARVVEEFVEATRERRAPLGLGKAVRALLDSDEVHDEYSARLALNDFEFEGFRFSDTWEWRLQDYDWWFLWALHAIVWGIAQYDAHHGREPQVARPQRPEVAASSTVSARPVVTVHLPESPAGGVS